MNPIELLRDLQRTLDLLQTIDRDLQAYPPDLAELGLKVKALEKAAAEDAKALTDGRAKAEATAKELAAAKKALERTQEELRHVNQKVQYASLIREKEEREKAVTAQSRPLKELEAKLQEIEARIAPRETELAAAKAQFDELRAVFRAEHGNQVAGQEELEAKRAKLEAELPAPELARFRKVAQGRGGKAVVAVVNGHCMGCRTRLRPPVMADLRVGKGLLACEACQRFLYLEA